MSETCAHCGSSKIMPDVRLIDHEDGYELDLNVEVYEDPGAKLDKRGHYGAVRARVCGDCGHARIFVTKAEELWQTYRRAQDARGGA